MDRVGFLMSAVLLAGCVASGTLVEPPALEPAWDPDHVLDVAITMPPVDWEALRHQSRDFVSEFAGDCRDGPSESPYTWFRGDVVIDGQALGDVGVRKKGFIGSQSVTKPGLRLDLDRFVDGAELLGVDNITLNNAVQDDALVRQCLTYSLFADAGVPASRCTFARVAVNDEDLGVYVRVEPINRSFLRRHFGSDDGDLVEGTLSDVHPDWVDTFDPKNDDTDPTLSALRAFSETLLASANVEATLEEHLDLDAFLTFWAAEVWTAHWDGYTGNQNNVFVYRDPATGRFHFIPWGVDGTLRLGAEGGARVFSTAYIAHRALQSPALRSRLRERLDALGGSLWDEDAIHARLDGMVAVLATQMDVDPLAPAIQGVRAWIDAAADAIDAAPMDADAFRRPFCLQEIGTLQAQFETTWGSSAGGFDGIWDAGAIDLSVVWDGYDIPFSALGVMSGPTETGASPWSNVVMAGAFQGDKGLAYAIPYVAFPSAGLAPGAVLPLDRSGPRGSLLYADSSTGFEAVEAAVLFGGQLELDAFQATPGAPVRGSLETGLFVWGEAP